MANDKKNIVPEVETPAEAAATEQPGPESVLTSEAAAIAGAALADGIEKLIRGYFQQSDELIMCLGTFISNPYIILLFG